MTNDELCAWLRANSSGIYRLAAEAADRMERMANWLGYECTCPCCTESQTCLDDCSFEIDCPDGAGRMNEARKALYGETP